MAATVSGQREHLEVVLLHTGHVDFAELAGSEFGIHPPVLVQLLTIAEFGQFAIFTNK